MKKWEYKVKSWTYDPEMALAHFLTNYGSEGWELIAIQGQWYIFKRELLG